MNVSMTTWAVDPFRVGDHRDVVAAGAKEQFVGKHLQTAIVDGLTAKKERLHDPEPTRRPSTSTPRRSLRRPHPSFRHQPPTRRC